MRIARSSFVWLKKTLTNSSFDRTKPATIDLSKVGEASVRYDPKLFEK